MKEPLVSVALATWNGEKFLKKQLDSLLAQTYGNIEIVISDDRSSDKTPELLREYKNKFLKKYRCRVSFNRKRLGFVKNFGKVISLCRGELIALCDQDDIWFPKKIAALVGGIGGNSLICSDAKLADEKGRVFADSLRRYSDIRVPAEGISGEELFRCLVYNNYVTGCTALFRRELLKTAFPIPAGEHYHDWWLALAASRAGGIRYLDKPLVFYRQHSSNDTGVLKKPGMTEKLFGFLGRTKNNAQSFKHRYAVMQAERMKALAKARFVSGDDRKFIREAAQYYDDRLRSGFHWKAFHIGVKYAKNIYPGKKGLLLLKAEIGGLLG